MPDYHSQSCHENLKHVAASRIDVVSSVVSLHYIQDAYITVISFERVGDLRTKLGLGWHGFRGALRFDKYMYVMMMGVRGETGLNTNCISLKDSGKGEAY